MMLEVVSFCFLVGFIFQDKTFGLKNKKGAKQQKFIKNVTQQVKPPTRPVRSVVVLTILFISFLLHPSIFLTLKHTLLHASALLPDALILNVSCSMPLEELLFKYICVFVWAAQGEGDKTTKKIDKKKELDELNELFKPVVAAQKVAKGL